MNTNTRLRTQAEGAAYIQTMLERHGSLARWVRGVHLHQSLSGAYVEAHTGAVPFGLPGDPAERFGVSYRHILQISRQVYESYTDEELLDIFLKTRTGAERKLQFGRIYCIYKIYIRKRFGSLERAKTQAIIRRKNLRNERRWPPDWPDRIDLEPFYRIAQASTSQFWTQTARCWKGWSGPRRGRACRRW